MGFITPTHPHPPYPLHPSVKDKLDPAYVSFYNSYITFQQQVHLQPISASRTSGILIPGGGPLLPVGSTINFSIHRRESEGADIPLRVFVPDTPKPDDGWPCMLYFHGGGWVLGNIDTENVICTNLCKRADCVVITVDYRLAPENPYPAAVHDAWESLLWLQSTGIHRFDLNPSKLAIGGSSAGGNLAAAMLHRSLSSKFNSQSASLTPTFKAQLLIVPVTDNTACAETYGSWRDNALSPALPAEKMLWYRRHYLPDPERWGEPDASPLLFRGESWKRMPRALVVVGELDVLRDEGTAYAEKLKREGVAVEFRIMKGMPHPFVAMDGILQQGRDTITAMVETLREVFA